MGWKPVLDLAEEHGLGPALWSALREDSSVPDEVATSLRRAHRSNAGRSMLLRRQLVAVVGELAAAGVDVMLLKGAAYLASDTFGDIGIREMSDLDIAIHEEDLDAAHRAMARAGFEFAPLPYDLEHHDRRYASPDAVAPVELHVRIGAADVEAALPSQDMWRRSEAMAVGSAAARVPSKEDALIHNVLHAEVQDREHAFLGVPVRQLHTFALAARAWTGTVDWSSIETRMRATGHHAHWVGHVHLARLLFGGEGLPIVDPGSGERLRTRARLLSFSLGWPTDVARNLWYALDPEYLEVRYGPIGSRRRLAAVRLRHLAGVARRQRGEVLADVSSRRR
jgi:hypothetical protein